MTGHRPFPELTKNFSPQRKAEVEALTNRLREEMTLRELQKARKKGQPTVLPLSESLGDL